MQSLPGKGPRMSRTFFGSFQTRRWRCRQPHIVKETTERGMCVVQDQEAGLHGAYHRTGTSTTERGHARWLARSNLRLLRQTVSSIVWLLEVTSRNVF